MRSAPPDTLSFDAQRALCVSHHRPGPQAGRSRRWSRRARGGAGRAREVRSCRHYTRRQACCHQESAGAGLRIGCWDVWSGVLPAASQPSDECLRLTTIPPVFTHRSSFSQSPSGTFPCAFDRVGGADSTPRWQGHGPSIARPGTVPNDFSAYFEAAP